MVEQHQHHTISRMKSIRSNETRKREERMTELEDELDRGEQERERAKGSDEPLIDWQILLLQLSSFIADILACLAFRTRLHADEEPSEELIPSGCCSRPKYDHPPTACQQRSGAVGPEECLPCLGSSA